jgi:hypothetical protein
MAPHPLPDESPASWILRTCIMHRVTYHTLADSLGLQTGSDPDIESIGHICRIGLGTNVPRDQLERMGSAFRRIRTGGHHKVFLNYASRNSPSYQVCRGCLSSDRIPYFRVAWRLKDWSICPVHKENMTGRCPTCSSPIKAARAYLDRLRNFDSGDLSECHSCGNSLALEQPTPGATPAAADQLTLLSQQAILSTIVDGFLPDEGREKFNDVDIFEWLERGYRLKDCWTKHGPPLSRSAKKCIKGSGFHHYDRIASLLPGLYTKRKAVIWTLTIGESLRKAVLLATKSNAESNIS